MAFRALVLLVLAACRFAKCQFNDRLRVAAHRGSADDGALRIYVAGKEVPVDTIWPGRLSVYDDLWGFGTFGDILAPEHELWHTEWHVVDMFLASQMMRSPLRVRDPLHADLVYVPLLAPPAPTQQLLELERRFMEDAPTLLPLLGSKPHVITLGHPTTVYKSRPLLTHPNSKHFTFLTNIAKDVIGTYKGPYDRFVGLPYFGHMHWSRATQRRHLLRSNLTQVASSKDTLACQAFDIRAITHLPQAPDPRQHVGRESLMHQCIAAGNATCRHRWMAGPAATRDDVAAARDDMARSWFTVQSWDDFVARPALFDALVVGSVPVVPSREFAALLPFGDVLDWGRMLEVVEDAEWLGSTECKCESSPTPPASCVCSGRTLAWVLADRYPRGASDLLPRLEAAWGVRGVLQYSLTPLHQLVQWGARHTRHPDDDALTFGLKALMRNLCERGAVPRERCGRRAEQGGTDGSSTGNGGGRFSGGSGGGGRPGQQPRLRRPRALPLRT